MSEIITNQKTTEEESINQKNIIFSQNKEKLSLRKIDIRNQLKEKRESVSHIVQDYLIEPKYEFDIKAFYLSYKIISSYLISNDQNLIIYSLLKLDNYFLNNPPNETDQQILLTNNFFDIFLNCLNNNDPPMMKLIISILNNILNFKEGSINNFKILYSEKYLKFYYNSFSLSDKVKNEIIKLLIVILKENKLSRNYINITILRSQIFGTIIKYYQDNENSLDADVIISIFELISKCVNLSFYDNDQIKEKDIDIIKNIFNIIIFKINFSENEYLIKYCYKCIHKISLLDNEYGLNEEIVKRGIPLKIMKSKIKQNHLNYALKIISNNLTLPSEKCNIIFENNIIIYYNDLISYYNNQKIIYSILIGISNISEGGFKEIVKKSNIWTQNNLEKIFNMNDDIKIIMIEITKNVILMPGIENITFIYNTKILEYMINLISFNELSEVVTLKMLKVIDHYLRKFKKEEQNRDEFLCVFYKLVDLFKLTDKILKINKKKNVIEFISNNIRNRYNFNQK